MLLLVAVPQRLMNLVLCTATLNMGSQSCLVSRDMAEQEAMEEGGKGKQQIILFNLVIHFFLVNKELYYSNGVFTLYKLVKLLQSLGDIFTTNHLNFPHQLSSGPSPSAQ